MELWTAILSAAAALAVVLSLMGASSALDIFFGAPAGGGNSRCAGRLLRALASALALASGRPGAGAASGRAFPFAPVFALTAALAAAAPIQFSPEISSGAWRFSVAVCDPGAGIVFSIAMIALWSCASFIGMLGEGCGDSFMKALSGASGYLSFYLAMSLSIASVLMVSGRVDFAGLVAEQGDLPWRWNAARQPFAFAIFAASACMAMRRPHAGSFERPDPDACYPALAAASGSIQGLSFSALSATLAAAGSAVFLGGWQLPLLPVSRIAESLGGALPGWAVEPAVCLAGLAAMLAKTLLLMAFLVYARATLPSLRSDRLAAFSWKALVPLAMANLAATAYIVAAVSRGA